DKALQLAEEIGGIGIVGSNLDADDLEKAVDQTISKWGRIDVVVNSSGHGPKGEILEITDDEWALAMDYYLLNVVRITRLVTPYMRKQKSGTIINISSTAAFEPDPLFPTSAVFRAGLASFSKLYANKYAAEGIRMNNVLPGFIDSLPETEDRLARIPMERYGQMQEVSALISYLASEDGAYMTGQNIRLDGGLTKGL
ncbi:MAG: SDR family oxidoreductase, partial [Alphaproteobacteria bacterium]|nr:SDR family oxidoreductase [Alphaproteobacteria bacterium]